MGGGRLAMAADTRDLGIEQRDPRVEFVQRIALQAFAGEEAGSAEVPLGRPQPRSIIIVHCDAASDWNGALSIGQSQKPTSVGIAAIDFIAV